MVKCNAKKLFWRKFFQNQYFFSFAGKALWLLSVQEIPVWEPQVRPPRPLLQHIVPAQPFLVVAVVAATTSTIIITTILAQFLVEIMVDILVMATLMKSRWIVVPPYIINTVSVPVLGIHFLGGRHIWAISLGFTY